MLRGGQSLNFTSKPQGEHHPNRGSEPNCVALKILVLLNVFGYKTRAAVPRGNEKQSHDNSELGRA